ncbi:WXG100 family type VII secretion target [Solihabitans fulvus]|uniref:WXG100 family type VII secretion target n=1 Tax=Solihabitans fulvus TaxID=1892852 RepID=A0A5B2XV43_9PSEU|nr:WXG100 family type VII secretion target [Solihabitans fulvus]KAA2267173.1 WXG100 family type VII secretion target [Solihabitans fulvus]
MTGVSGDFIHGDTEEIIRLAQTTIGNSEDMQSRSVALGKSLDELSGSWRGTSFSAFQNVSQLMSGDHVKHTNRLQHNGEKTRVVATTYDSADQDGHGAVGSVDFGSGGAIGAAINL